MTEDVDLYLVGGVTPVCPAHLDDWIDSPYWIATLEDYAVWVRTHGEEMSCGRCRGGASRESGGDPLGIGVSRADGAPGSDGAGVAGASGEEIARQFEAFLRHPSNSD